jgi:hypothetical protein
VSVLELYTSEGCNSCLPADRWLSALPARGFGTSKVVPLAFHVDYWNDLGWVDRYSNARFSQRQRAVAEREHLSAIYTPQFVLDGRDWRSSGRSGSLAARLSTINGEPARAQIRAHVTRDTAAVRVTGEVGAAARDGADAWIALFENDLSTEVRAGENGGKKLYHDFVVRVLIGPLRLHPDGRLTLDQQLALRPDWTSEQLGIAIFVQRPDNGEILQAVALARACPS